MKKYCPAHLAATKISANQNQPSPASADLENIETKLLQVDIESKIAFRSYDTLILHMFLKKTLQKIECYPASQLTVAKLQNSFSVHNISCIFDNDDIKLGLSELTCLSDKYKNTKVQLQNDICVTTVQTCSARSLSLAQSQR